MPKKVRYKRLLAVQADLELLMEAANRLEGQGHSASHHWQRIERLEVREQDLRRRIRDGADLHNAAADYQRTKTHCPQGHPYSADNLIVDKRGYRKCRACKRRYDLKRWRRLNGR